MKSSLLLTTLLFAPLAKGAAIIAFSDQISFEGDSAGSTSDSYIDASTGVTGTITTVSVSPSGVLNPNSGTLGINAEGSGDTAGSFDNGESWTFSWNVPVTFNQISLTDYGGNEQFSVSSSIFVGLNLTTGSNVAFNSGSGTFTFNNSGSSPFTLGTYSTGELTGQFPIIPANTGITISFSALSGSSAVSGMSFSLIPEPASTLAGLLIGAGVLRRRRIDR